jgi:hypothetical protein
MGLFRFLKNFLSENNQMALFLKVYSGKGVDVRDGPDRKEGG